MKCFLVFNQHNDPFYIDYNADFAEYIFRRAKAKGLVKKDAVSTELDANLVMQLFSPLVLTQKLLIDQMKDPCSSVLFPNDFCFVFRHVDDLLFVAINGNKSETEVLLHRKIQVFIRFMCYLFGPVDEEMGISLMFNKKAKWDFLRQLMKTWSEMVESEQAFFVEAIERLHVNQIVSEKCMEILEKAVKQIQTVQGMAPQHALLVTNNKLLALYSNRNAHELHPKDILSTMVLSRTLYPTSERLEDLFSKQYTNMGPKSKFKATSNPDDNSDGGEDEYHSVPTTPGGNRSRSSSTSTKSAVRDTGPSTTMASKDMDVIDDAENSLPTCSASESETVKDVGLFDQDSSNVLSSVEKTLTLLEMYKEKYPDAVFSSKKASGKKKVEEKDGGESCVLPGLVRVEVEVDVHKEASTPRSPDILPEGNGFREVGLTQRGSEKENLIKSEESVGKFNENNGCSKQEQILDLAQLQREESNKSSTIGHTKDAREEHKLNLTVSNKVVDGQFSSDSLNSKLDIVKSPYSEQERGQSNDIDVTEVTNSEPFTSDNAQTSDIKVMTSQLERTETESRGSSSSATLPSHAPSPLIGANGKGSQTSSHVSTRPNSQGVGIAGDISAPLNKIPSDPGVSVDSISRHTSSSQSFKKHPQPDKTGAHKAHVGSKEPYSVEADGFSSQSSSSSYLPYTPQTVFLETSTCPYYPYNVHTAQVLPGVTLILLSQALNHTLADTLCLVIHNVQDLLYGRRIQLSRARCSHIYIMINSLLAKLRSGLKRYKGRIAKLISDIHARWEKEEVRNMLLDFLEKDKRARIPTQLETTMSNLYKDLKELFSCLFLSPLQSMPQLLDALSQLRVRINAELLDYREYLNVKARRNITMTSYIDHFPGLIHFIFIDRHFHQMTAPSLNISLKAGESMDATSYLKEKIWKMYQLMMTKLTEGYTTVMMRDGDFYFSYFLWFEDYTGEALPVQESFKPSSMLAYPGILGSTFYRDLLQHCFPNAIQGSVHCFEMFLMHLGSVHPQYIAAQGKLLALEMWKMSREAYSVSLF